VEIIPSWSWRNSCSSRKRRSESSSNFPELVAEQLEKRTKAKKATKSFISFVCSQLQVGPKKEALQSSSCKINRAFSFLSFEWRNPFAVTDCRVLQSFRVVLCKRINLKKVCSWQRDETVGNPNAHRYFLEAVDVPLWVLQRRHCGRRSPTCIMGHQQDLHRR
jgi:hypothetical protein